MLIALPEIDGATNPTVFAGRHDADGCTGCARSCTAPRDADPRHGALPRTDRGAGRQGRAAGRACAGREVAKRKVAIVLYGFPPNAGAAGTAAYLGVFESLLNTLHAMAAEGYDLTPARQASRRCARRC